MREEENFSVVETKMRSLGEFNIESAAIREMLPVEQTDDYRSPAVFTDFTFVADIGFGKQTHTVSLSGDQLRYFGQGGVIEIIELSRNKVVDFTALIYSPRGSSFRTAIFHNPSQEPFS